MDKFIEALKSLMGSEVEFSIDDHDLSSIVFHKGQAAIPSLKEIQDEIVKIEEAKIKKENDDKAAKLALLNRLGITAEEAELLYK